MSTAAHAPRPATGILLIALACLGCSGPPVRQAAETAAQRLVAELSARRSLPQLVVVGGLRAQGAPAAPEPDAGGAPAVDSLAERLAEAVETALHERGLRIVDHRHMPLALDVLRLETTDLFPEDDPEGDPLRRLGRYLKADLYVTGSHQQHADASFDLELRVFDIHTLEVLATARGPSRTRLSHVAEGAHTTLAWLTAPLPALWDMLAYATDASYADTGSDGWAVLKGIGLWPVHLLASPFVGDWPATRWWVGSPAPDEAEPGAVAGET